MMELTFDAVDDLCLAAFRNRVDNAGQLLVWRPVRLGRRWSGL
jgi:hypothetical protein